MELEFTKQRPVVKVKIDDVVYDVKKPNNREIDEFASFQDDLGDSNALKSVIDLLDKLGLPKDVSWELMPEHLNKIAEALMPQKKS